MNLFLGSHHQFLLLVMAAKCLWAPNCFAVTPHPGFEVAINNGSTVVTSVYPDTPAEVMGIQPGDVVLKINKLPANIEFLRTALSRKRVGSSLQLAFRRGDEVHEFEVRLVDGDNPDSWAASAELVRKKILAEFRDVMDKFMAKHGPVQILGAQVVPDGERKRIAVRVANVSEHFLEACEMEVLFLDAEEKPVTFPDHDNPIKITFGKELPPANPTGTRGIVILESKQEVTTDGASTAVVTVKHARLANGQDYKPQEPQKVVIRL